MSRRLLAALYLSGYLICGVRAASAAPEPFQIGAFLSLTGDCADAGESARLGIELAIEEINAEGGILGRPVKLLIEDTKEANSVNAVTALKRLLLNPELHYLIGPTCSPAGLAVAPIAAQKKDIIVISPSIGMRQFNEAGDNIFKLWPYDEDGPRLLAEYAISKGWKRAALFSSQQSWEEAQGEFFDAAYKKLGGEVVAKVKPLPGEKDLRTPAMRLLAAKPDVVVLTNYITFDIAGQELAKQGYKGPKMSALMTLEKISAANGGLEGTISYGYEPATAEFLKRFKAKHNRDPWSIAADTAYDAMHLYARAINELRKDDPPAVAGKLRQVRDYAGASGKLSIDSKGGVLRAPLLFTVSGGQLQKN